MQIRIIYPDDRWVDASVVIGWAFDRRLDAALADAPPGVRSTTTFLATPMPTLREAIDELSDDGLVTFTKEIR